MQRVSMHSRVLLVSKCTWPAHIEIHIDGSETLHDRIWQVPNAVQSYGPRENSDIRRRIEKISIVDSYDE